MTATPQLSSCSCLLAGPLYDCEFHSLELLAPMAPHLRSLMVTWFVPPEDLTLLANTLPGLLELSLPE